MSMSLAYAEQARYLGLSGLRSVRRRRRKRRMRSRPIQLPARTRRSRARRLFPTVRSQPLKSKLRGRLTKTCRAVSRLNPADYPPLDRIPPLDSPEMRQWLSEIDLSNVPGNSPTYPGGCANQSNAQAVKDAGEDGTCWWTCGHW